MAEYTYRVGRNAAPAVSTAYAVMAPYMTWLLSRYFNSSVCIWSFR